MRAETNTAPHNDAFDISRLYVKDLDISLCSINKPVDNHIENAADCCVFEKITSNDGIHYSHIMMTDHLLQPY